MVKVSVVIPAYNEAQSVERTVRSIQKLFGPEGMEGEVVLVDDGSTDATAELARAAGARVLKHEMNRGYGYSLKTGIVNATHDTIVITDADGTYPIEMIPVLVKKMRDDRADMVVGARTGSDVSVPLSRRPFKWLLRRLAQFIVERPIPDLNSGLRVFRKDMAMRYYNLYPDGFSFTSTITVAAMCDDYRVVYVPIDYYKREGVSKIVPADFFAFLMLVLRLSVFFKPMRVFVPASLFCFSAGFLKFLDDIRIAIKIAHDSGVSLMQLPVVSASAVTLFLASLQIMLVGMVAESLVRRTSTTEVVQRKRDF